MPKHKKKVAHKHRARGPNKIEIIPGTPPTVDQPTVRISKKNKDKVEWWSRSKDWVVVFDTDTPFELHYYCPCNPGNKDVIGAYDSYKYTIYVDGNSADPIIIVDQ